MTTKVLSVGGSIIAPDAPDTEFLSAFAKMICTWLEENKDARLIFVAGGGGPARTYQNAYKDVAAKFGDTEKKAAAFENEADLNYACDWLGIMATRLNAQILKTVFGPLCKQDVVTDPTAVSDFTGRILVAAGWKPGFSTDNDAVLLAERFNADTVVNLSNIAKVYTDDPRKNPDAKPIDEISWADFRKIVGDEWVPGKNCPFDPIASKKSQELGLTVICAAGKDIPNIRAILDGKNYTGTTIR
ncbi:MULTISPECIES: UMP kinase [Treponema]|uniref:Uridylate kinase n=1 Tax=Treponema rectale TaxID=744512 RepID=A0A840SD28_9SPIR|nr:MULTISPECIES: UMP kinase [Treponema]MBB5218675.1 uridylate kinase [Treponema rectale]MBE6353170.1 UMP kinase [Treponema sp.]